MNWLVRIWVNSRNWNIEMILCTTLHSTTGTVRSKENSVKMVPVVIRSGAKDTSDCRQSLHYIPKKYNTARSFIPPVERLLTWLQCVA